MITIGKLLESKGSDVWVITPDKSVYDAIELMDSKNAGALAVVLDENLVGIISERDYARKIVLKNRTSKDTKVKDIMTTHVFYISPEKTVDECLVTMNERRVRHMPVGQDRRLVGMISVGDVVKEIIKEQQYTIQHLENNIGWEEVY